MWTVSPQKEQSSPQPRKAIFPPALSHSPVAPTELLSIHQAPPHPRQAQQKAFQSNTPRSSHTISPVKRLQNSQGRPNAPQRRHSTPLASLGPTKDVVIPLKERMHYKSFPPTIMSNYSEPQGPDRTFHLDKHHLSRAGNQKKAFPHRARLPEREDESSGNDTQKINTNQLSV